MEMDTVVPCNLSIGRTTPDIFEMDDDDAACRPITPEPTEPNQVLTLKQMCERVVASHCDMKNAVSVLAHAEVLDSPALANYALEFLMRNLDGVLVLGRPADLDFLIEEEADGINQMIQDRQQQMAAGGLSSFANPAVDDEEMGGFSSSPQRASFTPNLSSSPALTSHASTMISKISKGREPSLEEAVKWERALKKRMTQIEELERAKAQGSRLSPDQLAKVSRKDVVMKELSILAPVLNRLRFIHSARQSRAKSAELDKEDLGDSNNELSADTPEAVELMGEELLAKADAMMKQVEEVKPFGVRVCEWCKVTCTTQAGWDEHIMGKRHKKRMASVAVTEAQSNSNRLDQDQSPCPWLKTPKKSE